MLGKVFSMGEPLEKEGESSDDDDQLLGQIMRPRVEGDEEYF